MTALAGELARPVLQARSARTLEAILLTGRSLLKRKRFEELSVAEIANGAKCSVGGFYARFSSKDAMLIVLEQQLLEEFADELEADLEQADVAGARIPDLISLYIHTMVARFREHRSILQAVVRRNQNPGAVLPHTRRFNVRVHDALLSRILARRDEITHPDPDSAAVLGLFFASASARDAVLGNKLKVYGHQMDDEGLATELICAYLSYLGITCDGDER